MNSHFSISVLIPIMNEEGNIAPLYKQLTTTFSDYPDYEIVFIDDGSSDGTFLALKQLNESDKRVKYISFSRNFGHQNALKAGLDFASGDCVISMDGDLQHPPELIPEMIGKWQEGYDIVYTLRKDDPKIGIFKRITSKVFYALMNSLSDVTIEEGSADFRLIDKRVVDVLRNFPESPLFYRGLIKWLGFKQFGISYMPQERFWGKSKYSVRKMFRFAMGGITSFSIKPLHISTKLGVLFAILSFIYGVYAIWIKLFTNKAIEGWTSLLVLVSLIGGIQLISIGVLGEYIGKMFMEQKRRPNYIVKETSDGLNKSKV